MGMTTDDNSADPRAVRPAHQTSDRVLSALKTRGGLGIPDLAKVLDVTVEAVRQQMAKLQGEGLVEAESRPTGRGRPTQFWRLTNAGHARFPDTHAEMTVQMISAVIQVFGQQGMEQLIGARETALRASYLEALKGARSLKARLQRLADVRSREGYMAEVQSDNEGYLFVENHCPICTAAKTCIGFCRSELHLFNDVLGPDVEVHRVEHVLAGARRCAYRITPRAKR